MQPKHPATSPIISPNVAKKTWKSVTLEVKLDIIHRHERGEKTNSIVRYHGLTPATVSTILKSTDSIKKAGDTVSSLQAKRITQTRDSAMDKMESLLEMWINDQVHCCMPVSTVLIIAKAHSLWEDVQAQLPEEEKAKTPFGASKGWFDHFRKRVGLHNIQTTGESASADRPAADVFVCLS
ncbi:CENPB DNA-binding domain-containing protein 1 [Portunus trituberculatus]|uniref:CENPB DNA-binding domain-containing protein 1 n=1 Tax=Portunus trituberculatus TaxID=210409 RepID=A0A5B7FXT7_PORTR|nr:CENPB DNA-binding domain-containing protein 1 [Portunus trituberculatus]